MNEQIRKLRNEAEKWVADNFSTDELDPYEWWEKEEQKFAELIVEECALIAFHNVVNLSSIADAEDVEANIKEHFGVES